MGVDVDGMGGEWRPSDGGCGTENEMRDRIETWIERGGGRVVHWVDMGL
jgi:hypothetical protein